MATQAGEQTEERGDAPAQRPAPVRGGYRRQIDCTAGERVGARALGADERRAGERWPIRTDPSD